MNAIQTVTINSTDIAVKEYNGKRVVTFKDIDACHERPEGTARKRFNDNKYRFIEGEDYFAINQPSEIRTLGITRPQGGVPDKVSTRSGREKIRPTETGRSRATASIRSCALPALPTCLRARITSRSSSFATISSTSPLSPA